MTGRYENRLPVRFHDAQPVLDISSMPGNGRNTHHRAELGRCDLGHKLLDLVCVVAKAFTERAGKTVFSPTPVGLMP
ncbi:MAG: hypothetical protein ABF491_10180 [Acetobacter sp.]